MFIWVVLVALFCFFPILHGKFQVVVGNFLYLHRGDNSDQVTINPKLQKCRTAPLQHTVNVCSESSVFRKHESCSVTVERHQAGTEGLTRAAEPVWSGGSAEHQVKC